VPAPSIARIGLVGTSSTHAAGIARQLHRPEGESDVAVTCAWDRSGTPLGVADELGIEQVDSLSALLDASDVVLVLDRDGAHHADVAHDVIERGLPLFVDKPLTRSVRGASALVEHARATGTPLVSASALRWAPEVPALQREIRALRRIGPCTVEVRGPADPRSPWGGRWFYGIHVAEIACELADVSTPTELQILGSEPLQGALAGVRVLAQAGSVVLHVELVDGPPGSLPFTVRTSGGTGGEASARPLTVGPDYLAPIAEQIRHLATGDAPVHPIGHALAPLELLEASEAPSTGDPAGGQASRS
jgi:hypothetical protein